MNNNEFRRYVIQQVRDYCNEKQFKIKTNNGMYELEEFDFKKEYDEDIFYWLCFGNESLAYIRLREVDDKNGYVLIDNKRISLMIDNNFKRLTSYTTYRFNQSVDKLLKESANLKPILEFMINRNYMGEEFIKE